MKLHHWWSRRFGKPDEQWVWDRIVSELRHRFIPAQEQEDVADDAFLLYMQVRWAIEGRLPYIEDINYSFIVHLAHKNCPARGKEYIVAACVNRAVRQATRWDSKHDCDNAAEAVFDHRELSPECEAIRHEESGCVRAALKLLSPRQRVVIRRRFWGEHESLTAIGCALAIDKRRVSEICSSALRIIRGILVASA